MFSFDIFFYYVVTVLCKGYLQAVMKIVNKKKQILTECMPFNRY